MNQSRTLAPILILFLSILLLGGLVWANYQFSRMNIFGDGFSNQWISIQALTKTGTSPYSEQTTNKIRSFSSGGLNFIGPTVSKYTSPIYSGIVIFPFTLIEDEVLAHAFWLTAQLIAIFLLLLLCVKLTGWKPSWHSYLLFSLLTILSYHVLIPWVDGGLSIWAAFFMVLVLISLSTNHDEVAGVCLAMTTIQPLMLILPLIFILIWAITRKKGVLVLWFFITLIILSVIGLFLVPDWIRQYVSILYNFSVNFAHGSPSLFFSETYPGLGKQLGWFVTGITGIVLILEWFLASRRDFRWLLWTVCLTMVISQWIGIPTIPGNFVGLVIPLILVCAMLTERWPHAGQWAAILISLLLFIWEWVLFYLNLTGSQPAMQLNLIFPLPASLLVGLYWVRWWAIRPRRMLIEELRLSETY